MPAQKRVFLPLKSPYNVHAISNSFSYPPDNLPIFILKISSCTNNYDLAESRKRKKMQVFIRIIFVHALFFSCIWFLYIQFSRSGGEPTQKNPFRRVSQNRHF